ncbi:putative response regulator and transcription factor RR-A-type family [Dioscorea sansibarensis]
MSTRIQETSLDAPSLKHKMRVLVVNDSKFEKAFLVAILAGLGVETLVADNEKEALEATRKLRAMGVTTKIIGISTEDMRDVELEFLSAGADEFVPKPVKREKLMSILEEIDNEK